MSKQFVEEAVKLLVTRFIPLNPKDLDAWIADPEDWVNVEDKENDQWEYELRVGSDQTFIRVPFHIYFAKFSHAESVF